MQQQELDRLYQRILTNQATPGEKVFIADFLGKNPEQKILFDKLRTIWEIRVPEEKLINSEEKFEEIWKKGLGNAKKNAFASVFSDTLYYTVRTAATFMLIGILTYLFVSRVMNSPIGKDNDYVQTIQIKNPAGQQQKVYLPDGTVIWLNAESQLTYPSKFISAIRNVTLKGEGYFEVATDSVHPFVVATRDLSITVYGTSFNVKSNPGEERVQVSLLDGNVSVKNKIETRKLEPGWCYKYKSSTQEGETVQFDKEKVLAWRNGVLVFEEDNLEETITKLEKWYGVKIEVRGTPAREWILNAQFDNENIKAVMENLSFARNFSYTLKNNEISIFF